MFRSLVELIEARRESGRGITFIRSDQDETVISYSEFYTHVRRVLFNLQARGLQQGDELLFQVENNEHFLYVFWAALLGGIIPVPITVGNTEEHKWKVFRIRNVLNNPTLLVEKKRWESLQTFAAEQGLHEESDVLQERTLLLEDVLHITEQEGAVVYPEPNDLAFIQFSSGSTGDPKGVMLTHRNLLTNMNAIATGVDLGPGDSSLSWLPLTHDMGMIGCHMVPLFSDIDQLNMETWLFVRRPLLWMKKANQHRATILTSPNFGYKFFQFSFKPEAAQDWDLSCIKTVLNGAEPISAPLVQQFLDLLEPYGLKQTAIMNVYGLAEASLAVTFPGLEEGLSALCVDRQSLGVGQTVQEMESPEHQQALLVVELGRPVLDCAVRITDEENGELAENTVGCVQIRGGNVTAGYYNNPEATSRLITADGWLNTGDLGFQRDGRLYITGRAKDIIFVQGQNYYPHDIERIVEDIEGVTRGEAAACGVYNEELKRDEIHLFVLFKKKPPEFTPVIAAVKRRISERLGLTVGDVIPVKHIPKTTSGKIQRYKLAEAYRSGEYKALCEQLDALLQAAPSAEGAVVGRTATEQTLLQISRDVLGIQEIGLDDNFTKFGCTSLQMTTMHERVDKVYPGKLKISDLFGYPSVSMMADFIEGKGSLLLASVPLPEVYFSGAVEEAAGASFDLLLDAGLSSPLEQLAASLGLTYEAVMLALYTHLLTQVATSDVVTVQSMIVSDERVVPVTVDAKQVSELTELLRYVQEAAAETDRANAYGVQLAGAAVPNQDPRAVVPFFCTRELRKVHAQGALPYDLVFELFTERGRRGLYVSFNSRRLNKNGVKKLAQGLVKLAQMLVQAAAKQGQSL
ncbi:non-ribosomal peptide synthetase [Tumebacillus avium]|nr:non-ribosomal peptide synthetase [Tumebacillus avium]